MTEITFLKLLLPLPSAYKSIGTQYFTAITNSVGRQFTGEQKWHIFLFK